MCPFIKDNRDIDAIYLDKLNKQYAKNEDIFKCCVDNKDNTESRQVITELVAISLGLRGQAFKVFLTFILDCNGWCRSKRKLAWLTIQRFNLETSIESIVQSIDELIRQYVIIRGSGFELKIHPSYYIDESAITAKYLVIELNPNITSAPISL